MKTNVNMVRRMGEFEVIQRTKDGYFNATTLIKQWNEFSGNKKEINSFFKMKSTKEFIKTIEKKENYNMANSPYLKTRGKNGGTWMTSILFIDFAMWINAGFKYDVLKFVYDQLIEFRNDAGDNYKELAGAVQRFENINYSQMAKGLNYLVFGKHEKGIRQKANQYQLKQLNDLQKKMAFACDMGYINSFVDLLEEMRKIYRIKYFK